MVLHVIATCTIWRVVTLKQPCAFMPTLLLECLKPPMTSKDWGQPTLFDQWLLIDMIQALSMF